jgi:hypothetical protein
MRSYKLTVTFTEPILGTQPQKDVATEFVQAKAREAGLPVEDELETLSEMLDKGTTVFHRENGSAIYYDYHVKGFLKHSASLKNGADGVKALRAKFGNFVFVFPRRITLNVPGGCETRFLERPLRAQTMQGERVALARSEMLPAGTTFECEIHVINPVITEKILRDVLDYGRYCGFGQWRNASYGRFTYELLQTTVAE